MVFYSHLIGREIVDSKGSPVGKLNDFIADFSKPKPTVTFLTFKENHKEKKIPVHYLESLEKTGIFLNEEKEKLLISEVDYDKDMTFEEYILDQQVVDIDGQKVVRANDIVLDKIGSDFCCTSIDVGFKGITRRLGLIKLNQTLLSKVPQKLIKWENVETLKSDLKSIQLNVPHQKLAQMHPADIADLVETLSHKERAIFFKGLDNEQAADTLEESEPEVQRSVVRHLKKDRIAKILESMTPDEAVDMLTLFPKDKGEEFLCAMDPTKADVLRGIMKYDSDTAGGIMTTEYVSVPNNNTADQTIQLIRSNVQKLEHVHNIYVVDPDHRLVGAVSMKDLIVNKADALIGDIMRKRFYAVRTSTPIGEIKMLFKKYNLHSLPVVNDEKKLVGIITYDDVFDIMLPKST